MTFYEAVEDIVGVVPSGYEPLFYIACVLFALFILSNTFILIGSVINWIKGK